MWLGWLGNVDGWIRWGARAMTGKSQQARKLRERTVWALPRREENFRAVTLKILRA